MFKNFNGVNLDGRPLMTTVSFPYDMQLERMVMESGTHRVSFQDRTYPNCRTLNASVRDGSALGSVFERHVLFERFFPFRKELKMRSAKVVPQSWLETKSEAFTDFTDHQVAERMRVVFERVKRNLM